MDCLGRVRRTQLRGDGCRNLRVERSSAARRHRAGRRCPRASCAAVAAGSTVRLSSARIRSAPVHGPPGPKAPAVQMAAAATARSACGQQKRPAADRRCRRPAHGLDAVPGAGDRSGISAGRDRCLPRSVLARFHRVPARGAASSAGLARRVLCVLGLGLGRLRVASSSAGNGRTWRTPIRPDQRDVESRRRQARRPFRTAPSGRSGTRRRVSSCGMTVAWTEDARSSGKGGALR